MEELVLKQKNMADRIRGNQVKDLSRMYVAKAFDENLAKSHESIIQIGMALTLGGLGVLKSYLSKDEIEKWSKKLINEIWGQVH